MQLSDFSRNLRNTKILQIMKKATILFLILSTISILSCDQKNAQPLSGNLILVSGQSFGFCIGPCYQTMSVDLASGDVIFLVKNTELKGNQGDPKEETFKDKLSDSELLEIKNAYLKSNFAQLDEVYGCPDCADGGAEWIEAIEKDSGKKVTFEYGNSVKGMENLIILLRTKRTELSQKYVKTE